MASASQSNCICRANRYKNRLNQKIGRQFSSMPEDRSIACTCTDSVAAIGMRFIPMFDFRAATSRRQEFEATFACQCHVTPYQTRAVLSTLWKEYHSLEETSVYSALMSIVAISFLVFSSASFRVRCYNISQVSINKD